MERTAQRLFDDALRHHRAGRLDQATALYLDALVLNPDHADAHNNLGAAWLARGRVTDAINHYQRALALNPGHKTAHNNLGAALVGQNRSAEAIPYYERALTLNPADASALYNLGIAFAMQGRIADAFEHYRRAIRSKPDYAEAHNNLGNLLAAQGNQAEAIVHYARALAIDPDNAGAHNNLAGILRDQGKFDDALAHYQRALAIAPTSAEVHYNHAEVKTFQPGDADLAMMEALALRDDIRASKTPFLHFALAKALEDTGDYPRAFEHLRRGNDLKRTQIDYNEPAVMRFFERITGVFNRGLFDRLAGGGDPSSVPVFIVGMPRSGSSLIEQILASHPQVHGAGEWDGLETAVHAVLQGKRFPDGIDSLTAAGLQRMGREYLAGLPVAAGGKARIINKLPDNFLRVGLIRLIFPNARIIHTKRDPLDTCVSCYSKLFTAGQHFSYDMAELGHYYRRYRELMTHWETVLPDDSILNVTYENVIEDLETEARRLISYCGLPWDARCLSFHNTARPVLTASSIQVRKPLFRSSVQRWRRYESSLGPLLRELAPLTPAITV